MARIPHDIHEGRVDVLELTLEDLKIMGIGGEQDAGNIVRLVMRLTAMKYVLHDIPVQFNGAAAFVYESIHESPGNCCALLTRDTRQHSTGFQPLAGICARHGRPFRKAIIYKYNLINYIE
jgi:hypothetical protein